MAESIYRSSESSSEYSESCDSSCCSGSEEEYENLTWSQNVDNKGNLFYIDPGISIISRNYEVQSEIHSTEKSDETGEKSRLNPAAKLKKWMKKRNRKTRKSFTTQVSAESNAETPFFDLHSSFPSIEIFVEVDSSRQNIGRRTTLALEYLGIDIGAFSDAVHPHMENHVQIIGFSSGRKFTDIYPGDWLACINDEPVTLRNVDDILRKLVIPSIVKLTVYSLQKKITVNTEYHANQTDLIKELLHDSDALDAVKSTLLDVPCGAYYLVIEDESTGNEGVVYRYPDTDSALFQLKGMFITLSHMISDVASPNLLSCCVVSKDQLIHVGFVKEENQTFVLAFPASHATSSEVRSLTVNIVKILTFQFSNLKNAFSPEKKAELDHFFMLFFKYHTSTCRTSKHLSSSHLLNILPSVQWLPLTVELKTEIDDILSELESSDFGVSSDGFYENQRIYYTLGSCLFYKGLLLASHLPKADLLDIHLFLQYNHILRLTKEQAVSEMIIWREVFPNYLRNSYVSKLGYEVLPGRRVLLTIVMNHSILCVLLEDNIHSADHLDYLYPESFYIEEVQNTLIILHDCGIISATEKELHSCLPPVMSSEPFTKDGKSVWNPFSTIFSNIKRRKKHKSKLNSSNSSKDSALYNFETSSETSFMEKGDSDGKRKLVYALEPADGESDSESSYSECSDGGSSYLERSSKTHSFSGSSTSGSLESVETSQHDKHARRVDQKSHLHISKSLRHEDRMLIQYLDMDPVEGIFLSPIQNNCDFMEGSALKEIWNIFHQCCLRMRNVFARSLRNKEIIKSSTLTKYGVNKFLCGAYEQGTLFRYNAKEGMKPKSSQNSLNFWVVGRLLFTPEAREIYVCYDDSVHYDMVEFAFQMGFGLTL